MICFWIPISTLSWAGRRSSLFSFTKRPSILLILATRVLFWSRSRRMKPIMWSHFPMIKNLAEKMKDNELWNSEEGSKLSVMKRDKHLGRWECGWEMFRCLDLPWHDLSETRPALKLVRTPSLNSWYVKSLPMTNLLWWHPMGYGSTCRTNK